MQYNKQLRDPFWRTSGNVAPADTPKCGFDGSLCADTTGQISS